MHGAEDSVERVGSFSAGALVEASGSLLAVASEQADSVSWAGLRKTPVAPSWASEGSAASEGLALMAGSELAAS